MTPFPRGFRAVVWFVAIVALAAIARSAHAAAGERTLVTVPFKGPAQVEALSRHGIEIVAFTKHGMDVLADDQGVDYLMSRNYPVSVAPYPQRSTAALDANLGMYHTYAEMESTIAVWDTTSAYGPIFQSFSIGTSIEGRTLYAMKISDNAGVDENEPEVLFMANLHAREIMTVEMVIKLADYLLSNYGVDPAVTSYVDDREIFLVPMANPDGHVYVENNHGGPSGGWWRLNRRVNANLTIGVDLNRNFGYEWGYDDAGSSPTPGNIVYRGTAPFSEPETAAIRDFAESRHFTMWLSYHSYGELLLYPWGYIYADTPDNEVFAALGDSLTSTNGYLAGNPNSGAIYLTNGGSDDWGYGEQVTKDKVFAFTPEINSGAQGGFGPDDTLIQPTFDLLLDMNLAVLDFAGNPYRVVGPWRPVQYAVTSPYGNGIHQLNWSADDPADPNPVVSWQVSSCEDPTRVTDDGTMTSLWTLDGFTVGTGYSGDGYYSGSGDNLSNTLAMDQPWVAAAFDTLTFRITYDIENDWDYGYVELSNDGGATWNSIAGDITTTSNPNGTNLGNGFTGQSGGWKWAHFPLDAWAGQDILIRLHYVTDGAVVYSGFTVDDIEPVASCAGGVTLVSAITDTTLEVTPDAVATYRYRVRGIDAEGQSSRWSNSEDYTVSTLTAAGDAPRLETALGKNYPNPFNPVTHIPYTVGDATGDRRDVTLRIYDVTGALVATLVDGPRSHGVHRVDWNGRNGAGQTMASGIYFARLLVSGDQPLTRKLVLLK